MGRRKIKESVIKIIRKKELLMNIIPIFLIVIALIGTSYSAFLWSETSSKQQTLVAGTFAVGIDDSSPTLGGVINIPNAYPMSDEDGINSEKNIPYKFKIQNTGNIPIDFTIKLVNDESIIETDVCSDKLLNDSNVKINISGDLSLSTTTINTLNESIILSGILEGNTEKTISLSLWIKSDASNDIIGKHFHKKLVIDSSQINTLESDLALADISGKSNGLPLGSYRIYGNSTTTDGVTTSLGENSKNLFDSTLIIGYTSYINGEYVSVGTHRTTEDFISVISNETYILSDVKKHINCDVAFFDENNVFIGSLRSISGSIWNINDSFSIPPEGTKIKITIYNVGFPEADGTVEPILKLEEGNQATEYRPYRYIDVESSGKNLFDKSNPEITGTAVYQETNTGFTMSNFNFSNNLIITGLPINESITIYARVVSVTTNNFQFYYDNYTKNKILTLGVNCFTITPTINGIAYISSGYNSNKYSTEISDFMIVKGTHTSAEMSEYEPYVEPTTTTIDLTGHNPLRSLGEIRDYIEYPTNKLVRKIGVNDNGELYELTTPVEEDITLPKIPTKLGYTNVSIPYGGMISTKIFDN